MEVICPKKKNMTVRAYEKTHQSRSGSTPKKKHTILLNYAPQKKFDQNLGPRFVHCVFYNLRHGQKKWAKEVNIRIFLGPPGPRWDSGGLKFRFGICDKTAGGFLVLSVFVVPSVSVESVLAVSLSGNATTSQDHCSK